MKRLVTIVLVLISNYVFGQEKYFEFWNKGFLVSHNSWTLKWGKSFLDNVPNRTDSIYKSVRTNFLFKSFDESGNLIAYGQFHIHDPENWYNEEFCDSAVVVNNNSVEYHITYGIHRENANRNWTGGAVATCHYSLVFPEPCPECPSLEMYGGQYQFSEEEIRRFSRR